MKMQIRDDKLWPHQCDSLYALGRYPWQDDARQRQAAVLMNATAGGKTRIVLCRVATASGRSIIVAPNIATAKRYQQEWTKIRNVVILGHNLPKEIPVIHGKSAASALAMDVQGFPFVIVTVQYLLNRVKEMRHSSDPERAGQIAEILRSFKFLEIDEGHHLGAAIYKTIIDAIPDAKVTYYTGTPIRTDGELLPYAPYTHSLNGKRREYRLRDVRDVTDIDGARYTLADALRDQRIKAPMSVPIRGEDLLADRGDLNISADSFDALERAVLTAQRNDDERYSISLLRQDLVMRSMYEAALFRLRAERQRCPGCGKLSAISKALNRHHALWLLGVAQEVGWYPVLYVMPGSIRTVEDEEDDQQEFGDLDLSDKEMEANLRRFEDPCDETDLLIQVSRLTEGYDHPPVTMAILSATIESELLLEQFVGRTLRPIPNRPFDSQPRALIVHLDTKRTVAMVTKYCSLFYDPTYKERGGHGPGPEGSLRIPIRLDEGDIWLVGEPRPEDIARAFDPIERWFEAQSIPAEHREVLRAYATSGQIQIPDLVEGAEAPPQTSAQVIAACLTRKAELRSFVVRNGGALLKVFPESERGKKIHIATSHAIKELVPSCSGGFKKNKRLTVEACREFLTFDMNLLKDRAISLLQKYAREHRRNAEHGTHETV